MVPCSLHTRTNRLRIGDRIRDPSRMAMQAPTKLHRSGGPRGFGRKEHFTRQLLSMCPRPDSTQSTRGPDSYLFFSPHQTLLSTPRPESSRLGVLGGQTAVFRPLRPRRFQPSDPNVFGSGRSGARRLSFLLIQNHDLAFVRRHARRRLGFHVGT